MVYQMWFQDICLLGTKWLWPIYIYSSCMLFILTEENNKGALLNISGLLAEIWGHFSEFNAHLWNLRIMRRQFARQLNVFVRQSEHWWMWPYCYVFKCLLTFVLITSAGEDDADTWMMSMIHVQRGVEVSLALLSTCSVDRTGT